MRMEDGAAGLNRCNGSRNKQAFPQDRKEFEVFNPVESGSTRPEHGIPDFNSLIAKARCVNARRFVLKQRRSL